MSFSRKVVCPYCQAVNRIPAERLDDNPRCGKCGEEIFRARPLDLDQDSFQHHLSRSEVPVLVDFWAPWCGPCKMMAPAFEQAAVRLEPRVRLAKLNTDEAQEIAGQYGIRSIPTMILFDKGEEIARHSGAMMGGAIENWVEAQLANEVADTGINT